MRWRLGGFASPIGMIYSRCREIFQPESSFTPREKSGTVGGNTRDRTPAELLSVTIAENCPASVACAAIPGSAGEIAGAVLRGKEALEGSRCACGGLRPDSFDASMHRFIQIETRA
jgi:hypothetical protein